MRIHISTIKTLTMEIGFTWFLSLVVISSFPTSYSSSPSKYTAVVPLNATCLRSPDCTSDRYPTYLRCVGGRCTCESHTYYDDYDGICRIRYPSQCKIRLKPSEKVQPCVTQAICAYPIDQNGNELKNALHGTCQCLINRSPNPDGTCSGFGFSVPNSNPLTTLAFTTFAIFIASRFQIR